MLMKSRDAFSMISGMSMCWVHFSMQALHRMQHSAVTGSMAYSRTYIPFLSKTEYRLYIRMTRGMSIPWVQGAQ